MRDWRNLGSLALLQLPPRRSIRPRPSAVRRSPSDKRPAVAVTCLDSTLSVGCTLIVNWCDSHAMLRSLVHANRVSPACRFRTIASLSQVLARHAPIDVHPEVQQALAQHAPIVALETTIVTHGMPHPTNLETAISVENIVREQGAIPATIGIIGGRVKIGLDRKDLEHLADTENDPPTVKISRRDIASAIAMKRDGGTTCSATLIFAAMAGIKVRT